MLLVFIRAGDSVVDSEKVYPKYAVTDAVQLLADGKITTIKEVRGNNLYRLNGTGTKEFHASELQKPKTENKARTPTSPFWR